MGVSLRPVCAPDLPTIERWAGGMADHMSRTRPYAECADGHDPGSGLYWYVIREHDLDVGTVWLELLPDGSEAVLGVFLGDASQFGRGIGSAAIELAIAEFRRVHPRLSIVLRVRRSNTRAIACYRRVGFAFTGGGSKSLPSGEVVSYLRMVRLPE
jgi:ribosomal protein S18 acetylase RimI-like enzyme